MDLSSIILLLNIINSIIHPIKHIPQIIHTIQRKCVDDLSLMNIVCELIFNLSSITSFLLIYFYMGKNTFLIPIVIEKFSSFIFITTIFYLKKKYSNTIIDNEIEPLL